LKIGDCGFVDCGLTVEIGDLGLRLGIEIGNWDLRFEIWRFGDLAIWRFEIGDLAISDWGIIDDSGAQFRNTILTQQSQSSIPITNRQSQSAVSIANRQSQSSTNNRRSLQSAVRSPQFDEVCNR
jgi:hypothetical protein